MNAHWSLGVLIGLPVLILLLTACVILSVIGFKRVREDSYSDWVFFKWLGMAAAVFVLGIILVGYFPYSAQYHRWEPISGRVTQVSSRLLGDGNGGMTQRFVVRFANGDYRSCDDTRCSLVKPGDYLALTCKEHWQFAGTSGYDCNFVSRRAG